MKSWKEAVLNEGGSNLKEKYNELVERYFNGDYEMAYDQATSYLAENDLLFKFEKAIKNGKRF